MIDAVILFDNGQDSGTAEYYMIYIHIHNILLHI